MFFLLFYIGPKPHSSFQIWMSDSSEVSCKAKGDRRYRYIRLVQIANPFTRWCVVQSCTVCGVLGW